MLKFEYLGKEVFYQRGYAVILSDLCNGIKKRLREILCHKHFKYTYASCGFN